jgi:hypothetical protein
MRPTVRGAAESAVIGRSIAARRVEWARLSSVPDAGRFALVAAMIGRRTRGEARSLLGRQFCRFVKLFVHSVTRRRRPITDVVRPRRETTFDARQGELSGVEP